ncbi:hypothetical protein GF338_10220 [candidate division WOR-3 bacterium]|nr:hypothetical protein [candidate division WOR-3 bacterium]
MKKWVSIALVAVVAMTFVGMEGCNGTTAGALTNVNVSVVDDADGNPGGGLHVTWSAPSEGTPDEYIVYVDGTAQVAVTTTEDYVYTPCAEIEVAAVYGTEEEMSSSVDIGAVSTSSIDLWSVDDISPNHPSGFGFASGGSAGTYAVSSEANWPEIDYYIASGPAIASPSDHLPTPLNDEENAVSMETGTFDDLGIVAETGQGLYLTNRDLSNNGLYGLWIDANANGWDDGDHFGKLIVNSIDAGTYHVNISVAYQTEGGLRFVVE